MPADTGTPTAEATPTPAAPPYATVNAPPSNLSVKQVQHDITAACKERESLMGKVNDYKMRVYNMDLDSKRTEISVTALVKHRGTEKA